MTKIAFSSYSLDSKIASGDSFWGDFNRSFDNVDLDSIEIINLIYTGYPFTTWHTNNWRTGENYQLGQHIGIDFDTGDANSSLAHLAADKFIAKYADSIYTTPSHTPEAPRARVLFLLDTPIHQSPNYTLAVASLLWLFGGTADRKCKDAVRFFYGSIGCDVEYIANVLPLDVLRTLIGQYKATGLRTKRQHEGTYKAPVDQAKVADAIKHIDPMGIDYDEWLSVLMGIHNEFGDGGLPLAEGWAKGTDGEVERKWRSFKQGGATTIASTFRLAMDHGWKGLQ